MPRANRTALGTVLRLGALAVLVIGLISLVAVTLIGKSTSSTGTVSSTSAVANPISQAPPSTTVAISRTTSGPEAGCQSAVTDLVKPVADDAQQFQQRQIEVASAAISLEGNDALRKVNDDQLAVAREQSKVMNAAYGQFPEHACLATRTQSLTTCVQRAIAGGHVREQRNQVDALVKMMPPTPNGLQGLAAQQSLKFLSQYIGIDAVLAANILKCDSSTTE